MWGICLWADTIASYVTSKVYEAIWIEQSCVFNQNVWCLDAFTVFVILFVFDSRMSVVNNTVSRTVELYIVYKSSL